MSDSIPSISTSRSKQSGKVQALLIAAAAVSVGTVGWFSGRPQEAPKPTVAVAQPTGSGQADVAPASILAEFETNVKRDALTQVNAQEEAVTAVSETLLRRWEADWVRGSAASFSGLLTSDAKVADLSPSLPAPQRLFRGITRQTWNASAIAQVAADGAATSVERYLGAFRRVVDLSLDVDEARLSPDGSALELATTYDLRGVAKDGALRQDRGRLGLTCVNVGGTWKIRAMTVTAMETMAAPAASFVDATQKSGLGAAPVYPRLEAIRRGGYAVAMGDYDKDGHLDVFMGAWGPCKLFKGRADGTFTDATSTSGLDSETLVKAAAFVDIDGNGTKDLVLSRFVTDNENDVVVYVNDGKRFTRSATPIARTQRYDRAMPMAVADFNNDGLLDLYVGFPGKRDFTVLDFRPQQLSPQGVFLNQGKGVFTDATAVSGINTSASGASNGPVFPHASVSADWDGDGAMDLVVVDDRRNRTQVYRNTGGGAFTDATTTTGIQNQGWGMGVAVGDYDNDGLPDLYVSNIDFTAARRLAKTVGSKTIFTGNRLYRNTGGGRFEDVTDKAGVAWAGQAAGGCEWVDYDNDGKLDLYVMNGLWTGTGTKDMSSLFVRNYLAEREAPSPRMQASVSRADAEGISLSNPDSSNLVMKVLNGYRGADGTAPTMSMAGNQRKRLFHNDGNGHFTEVGFLEGVDRAEDGYVLATCDYNKDGKVDFVLRNADPGVKEKTFPTLVLLENTSRNGNRGLAVYLEGDGKKSNRDAVGATVRVWTKGASQSRWLTSLNGASQSEAAAFFGLGTADKVDRIQVRWPSGKVETFPSVKAGRVVISEGKGLARL